MAVQLHAICFEALDPQAVARFWGGLLGWTAADDVVDGAELVPSDDAGFRLCFVPTTEPKSSQNHAHFDLTSESIEHQQRTVQRALDLGGRHIDIGQDPDDLHVVLADPEGNEFCVIDPGNNFLSDCGFVGALACGGSQEVGYFWSTALGWPLVWDQDQETAIRSPHGGPKLTWGGPPFVGGRSRVSFEVVADAGGLDRLVARGASWDGDVLLDPDGRAVRVRV